MVEVEYIPGEDVTRQLLNARFHAIRTALHANPTANIDALVNEYRADVEQAYGVTFLPAAEDSSLQKWGFVGIHFARLAMERIAAAFKLWLQPKLNTFNINQALDQYDLYRRVLGGMTFSNSTAQQTYPAQTGATTVTVYAQTSTRQWVMTPNNAIHELGHALDDSAAFGVSSAKLGSLEYGINDSNLGGGPTLHSDFSSLRPGMAEGRLYLRERFNEHATISLDTSALEPDTSQYAPIPNARPPVGASEYDNFVPERYLLFDLTDGKYSLWNSPVYMERYGASAYIDTLVQNETSNAAETAADAFLNWVNHIVVRPTFVNASDDEADAQNAQKWNAFFRDHFGIFLRNSVIFRRSAAAYYLSFPVERRPIKDIEPVTLTDVAFQFKALPIPGSGNELDHINLNTASANGYNVGDTINVYGWHLAQGYHWLLIEDVVNRDEIGEPPRSRLVWIASDATNVSPAYIGDQNNEITETNAELVAPNNPLTGDDIRAILEAW
jgi:hypothetical protein